MSLIRSRLGKGYKLMFGLKYKLIIEISSIVLFLYAEGMLLANTDFAFMSQTKYFFLHSLE